MPTPRLPEVIRTEEHEDVDGHTGKPARLESRSRRRPSTPSQIDDLILKGLAANKTPVSAPTNDEEFIRRVYLDVLGRLPEPRLDPRVRRAPGSGTSGPLLIDALLDQPRVRRELGPILARRDRLPVAQRERPAGQLPALREVAGRAVRREQALGRDRHRDHHRDRPERRERRDRLRRSPRKARRSRWPARSRGSSWASRSSAPSATTTRATPGSASSSTSSPRSSPGSSRSGPRRPRRASRRSSWSRPTGPTHYSMPDLKNPDKKIPVAPRFFLNDAPKVSEQVKADERLKLVGPVHHRPRNPWFARAFINRVWYSLMGEGFYNPVDDLGPTRTPNSPEVLDLVAEQWVQSGYDIRWLFRTILNTEAYQRASRSTNTARRPDPVRLERPEPAPGRPDLRRPDPRPRPRARARRSAAGEARRRQEGRRRWPRRASHGRDNFLKTFGVDPSTPNDDVLGTIPQALFLMNSPLVTREVQARPNSMLGYLLMTHPDNRSVLDILYLRALGRRPTEQEVRTCSNYLHGGRRPRRGVRGHPLGLAQLDRVPQPSLTRSIAGPIPTPICTVDSGGASPCSSRAS